MGRIGNFLMGVVVGGVLIFGAQRYHLVRAKDGFYLVPKMSATFSDAYVDVRSFTVSDWAKHKSLAAAIIQAIKENLLQDSAEDGFRDNLRNAIDRLTSG